MGKFTDQWKEKSDRTLGHNRGRGVFSRMLMENDVLFKKKLLTRRIPRPDNSPARDHLDLI